MQINHPHNTLTSLSLTQQTSRSIIHTTNLQIYHPVLGQIFTGLEIWCIPRMRDGWVTQSDLGASETFNHQILVINY